ncbi:MAG TPA: 6-phosphogluconolactonase [Terriglobales bacterium]|nr:6-phosphogluconolactonase [Terriglobales bacterium]
MTLPTNGRSGRRSRGELRIYSDPEQVASAAADVFVELAAAAIAERGHFDVALAGGSTPRRCYELLAQRSSRVDWSRVVIFWGDERYVLADHPESNYRMAYEALLAHVPLLPGNVHRARTEMHSAQDAAQSYEDDIRQTFATLAELPVFDLVLLGLGTDGHTASLFPKSPALHEHARLVVADYVQELEMWRVTMTAPLLNAARHIAFLVVGHDKAGVLREVISGPDNFERLPAQLIEPNAGSLLWIVDEAAAHLLR